MAKDVTASDMFWFAIIIAILVFVAVPIGLFAITRSSYRHMKGLDLLVLSPLLLLVILFVGLLISHCHGNQVLLHP